MRTVSLSVLAVLILVPFAFAEEAAQPSIYVPPLQVSRKLMEREPEVGSSTADLLRGLIVKSYRCPSTRGLRQASKTAGVSSPQLHADLEACADFDRAAGVDLVLTGRLHSFGDKIVLHLRLVGIPPEGAAIPKSMAMQQCAGLEDIPSLLPDIIKAFGLVSSPAVKRIALAVGPKPKWKPEKVDVQKLIKGLDSDDAGVRFSFAIELGRSGKQEAIEPLMKLARTDKDYFVAACANQAIINITGHDCGFKDGLTAEEKAEALRAARTWWRGQDEDGYGSIVTVSDVISPSFTTIGTHFDFIPGRTSDRFQLPASTVFET